MAVNLLLSFAFHGPTKSKIDLWAVRRDMVCGLMMLDSGAFTAHTTGATINIGDYAAWLETYRGAWDHAITLDVVGDPAASGRNTRKLHERGLPVMPVFTTGGSLAEFDAMVRDCGYVACGGLAGSQTLDGAAVRARVALLQHRARVNGGGIHALGVQGRLDTIRAARPYSADGSAASSAFFFSKKVLAFDGIRVNTYVTQKQIIAARHLITGHGIDVAPVIRTGRMTGGAGRLELFRGFLVAFACADEVFKRTHPVPAPARPDPDLPAGPHIYSAVVTKEMVGPGARLDRDLHTDYAPLAWRRHSRGHRCRPRPSAAVHGGVAPVMSPPPGA